MKINLKNLNSFKEFCKLNNNRKELLISILQKEEIPYSIVSLDGSDNIVLFPYNLINKSNVLLAHYDRVENTPGANDNSASVFYLLFHAKRIKDKNHSTIIIFTDKEEIGESGSVKSQGSYSLGNYLKSKKITNLSFFVFDMCGIGTTILLGTAGVNLIKEHYKENYEASQIKKKIDKVKYNAEDILLTVNNGEFFYLTPLFSDDLGLILNEYPAVLISLLPYREAVNYKKNPTMLPKSWQNNHTLEDNINSLDSKSWDAISPLLLSLSGLDVNESTIFNNSYSFKCYHQNLIVKNEILSIKPLLNYIKNELFNVTNIQTVNSEILSLFQFMSSEITPDALNYFKNLFKGNFLDISFNIYTFIENRLANDFDKLPIAVKEKINKKTADLGYTDKISFIYENLISCLEPNLEILSEPIGKKSLIEIDIKSITKNKNIIILKSNENLIGEIDLIIQNGDVIVNKGVFNPEYLLKFDPLNILKGLRVVLIKWTKLNNNNTLRFNLTCSNWIGCYQFYNLVKMELDKRLRFPLKSNLVYLWKRYYGQQS